MKQYLFFLLVVVASCQSAQVELEQDEYLACGCGCCPDVDPEEFCLNEEDFQTMLNQDKSLQNSPQCANAPCDKGVLFTICES